jgi:AraC-type transcriptional regulator N-terminus
MDLMNPPPSEREARRAQTGRDELAERVARAVREDGVVEAPGGLSLLRHSSPTPKDHGVSSPAFCVIAQGSKEVLLGDDCYRYDANCYLITAAALPTATRVTEASVERPYLGVVLGLDPALVGSVMVEAGHPAPREHAAVRAFDVSPLDTSLLDALVRLVGLLDAPSDETRFLRPLITREIVFRLLKGEQGGRLRQIAFLGGHSHRIARALRLGLPPPLQGGHRDEPPTVPEAAAPQGGAPPHARRGSGRRERRLPRGLLRRLALHPGVQAALRRTAYARRGTASGSRHGERPPVSRSEACARRLVLRRFAALIHRSA